MPAPSLNPPPAGPVGSRVRPAIVGSLLAAIGGVLGATDAAANPPITFAPPVVIDLPSGHFPTQILPVDIDGDGWLDLIVPGRGNAGTVFLIRGGPGGSLGPPTPIAAGVPADSVVAADFDGDGHRDLVLAGRRLVGKAVVLRGLGGGEFAAPFEFPLGREPRGVDAADLDGDGRLDLVFANYNSSSVEAARGEGLSFEPGPSRVIGREFRGHAFPVGVHAADLDGDGRPEAIVPAIGSGRLHVVSFASDPQGGALRAGRVWSIAPFPVNDQQPSLTTISLLDLEGDGRPSVLVPTLLIAPVQHLFLFRNDGAGGLSERSSIPLLMLGYLWTAALADFNGDGRFDLATGSALPGRLSVWRNLSSKPGEFESGLPQTLFEDPFIRTVVVADLDRDGRPDLLATAYDTHRVVVFLNRSGDGVAGSDGDAPRRSASRSGAPAEVQQSPLRQRVLPRVDRNDDGRIDAIDLALELAAWGPEFTPPGALGKDPGRSR
jgi:hypothetical protein